MSKLKLLLPLMVLLLWGCQEKKVPLPLEEPPQETVIEQEEEVLTPEEMALQLIGEKASIITFKRRLDNGIAVLEVLVEEGGEQFVYLIDPEEKKIISLVKREETSEELSLEEAHFLAREALGGTTILRGIKISQGGYLFTFEKETKGWEVKLDKNSQKAEVLGEVPLSELLGKINMDLFQAIKKTEVIYGQLYISEVYYEPWNDSVSHIVIKAEQKVDGIMVSKIFEMDTYSGVITATNE